VGRKRKDPAQGLPARVYLRSGSFYYVHRETGRWENIGKDLAGAKKRAEHYNDPTGAYGTMSWFLDQFIIDCEQRSAAGKLARRTVDDYRNALRYLKPFFGGMLPSEVRPHHVSEYLAIGDQANRAVRANRERACLSACISWMLRSNHGGLLVNPCMRKSGVQRNAETERDRYVTHEEYNAVFEVAGRAVRLMMELTYRTLQRPESDIIGWTTSNVVMKGHERVLRFEQHKTRAAVDIALTGRLGELVRGALGDVPVLHQPIVHSLRGEKYSYSGLSAMLKRAQAQVRKANPQLRDMASFGFRDLKGKGATDMWLAGEPIERIQLLCGHKNKATTEKYIKSRYRETVQPNLLTVGS
jgi:integrase